MCFTSEAVCGPVQVKVGVKDNQTTNTQVTAIMRDVGLRNYGEFNEPFLSRIDRFSLGPIEEGSKRGRDSSRGGRGSS